MMIVETSPCFKDLQMTAAGERSGDEASGSGMPTMSSHRRQRSPRRIAEEGSLDVREVVHTVVKISEMRRPMRVCAVTVTVW